METEKEIQEEDTGIVEVEDKVQEEDDWIVDERVGGGGSCSPAVCREQECGTAVCREQLTKEGPLAPKTPSRIFNGLDLN